MRGEISKADLCRALAGLKPRNEATRATIAKALGFELRATEKASRPTRYPKPKPTGVPELNLPPKPEPEALHERRFQMKALERENASPENLFTDLQIEATLGSSPNSKLVIDGNGVPAALQFELDGEPYPGTLDDAMLTARQRAAERTEGRLRVRFSENDWAEQIRLERADAFQKGNLSEFVFSRFVKRAASSPLARDRVDVSIAFLDQLETEPAEDKIFQSQARRVRVFTKHYSHDQAEPFYESIAEPSVEKLLFNACEAGIVHVSGFQPTLHSDALIAAVKRTNPPNLVVISVVPSVLAWTVAPLAMQLVKAGVQAVVAVNRYSRAFYQALFETGVVDVARARGFETTDASILYMSVPDGRIIASAPQAVSHVTARIEHGFSFKAKQNKAKAIEFKSEADLSRPALLPLLQPRWQRAVLSTLSRSKGATGPIDLDQVLQRLVLMSPLEAVPRLVAERIGPAHILIDTGDAMTVFARDQEQLTAGLRRVIGEDRTSVFRFRGTPLNGVRALGTLKLAEYKPPGPTGCIILLSDLGIGEAGIREMPPPSSPWRAFDRAVRKSVGSIIAMVPYPAERWPAGLPKRLFAVPWDRATSVRTIRSFTRGTRT